MNPLVRKEIRLILPMWILAMALAVAPVWLVGPMPQGVFLPAPGVAVYAFFVLGVMLLAITPFGHELGLGMFSIQLAQPLSRRHMWLVKTLVLAVALGLAFLAFCISNQIRVETLLQTMKGTVWRSAFNRAEPDLLILRTVAEARTEILQLSLLIGGLAALAAFAGGLWSTLLFRQSSAAFWFTFLVPMSLVLLVAKALSSFPPWFVAAGVAVALVTYSVLGAVWAKRLFLRAQDTQWAGRTLALPEWWVTRTSDNEKGSGPKPLRALFRREFHSHQINLMIAAGILLVHLVSLAVRRFNADYFAVNRSTALIWESIPIVWLAMPLLVGGAAVAEERKLSTLESALCLPVSRRLQFFIKLGVALLLGLLLGAVVPVTLEGLGGLGPGGLAAGGHVLSSALAAGLVSVILTSLAFYASTLGRSTVQALGVGVGASLVTGLVIFVAANPPKAYEIALWSGPLMGWIGVPIMVNAVGWLAYGNYKHLAPGKRIWVCNASVLLLLLAGTAASATAVYHRAWEAWIPSEPLHGGIAPWRYNVNRHQAAGPKLEASSARMALVLPDGRLWLRQRPARREERMSQGHPYAFVHPTGSWRSGLLAGSDWREVAVSDAGAYALRRDGSLWDVGQVQPSSRSAEGRPKPFGEDARAREEWQTITAGGEHFTGLKSDGTLWEWGGRTFAFGQKVTQRIFTAPTQVGTDSDWIAICDSGFSSAAVKRDGSVWMWRGVLPLANPNPNGGGLSPVTTDQPEKWLQLPDEQPVSLSLNGNSLAEVSQDGSLWIGGNMPFFLFAPEKMIEARKHMVRLSEGSDWSQVSFIGWRGLAAIKRDGSLWVWGLTPSGRAQASTPSQYSDWIAVCPYEFEHGFLALAQDGSLCMWDGPDDGDYFRFSDGVPQGLLLPSRVKARRLEDFATDRR